MKAEPSRLIPWKPVENLELVFVLIAFNVFWKVLMFNFTLEAVPTLLG